MKNKLKIYCAGGWFSPNQEEVLTAIEKMLIDSEYVEPYLPRHDGVKLSPGELHDSALRKRVFEDNVKHIREADLVVAACDGRDGTYDTGTQWEIGYAMANNIPVIAYDTTQEIYTQMKALVKKFYVVCHHMSHLEAILKEYYKNKYVYLQNKLPLKILFVGPDMTEEQREMNKDIVSSVILECHGSNFRWVDDLNMESLSQSTDDIFKNVDYMISVIDDRHPIVSWLMGQAYSRKIPVITYTNFDYGVNIMLLCSLLYHCKGKEELKSIMQKMKRDGIYSLPEFDDSSIKAM